MTVCSGGVRPEASEGRGSMMRVGGGGVVVGRGEGQGGIILLLLLLLLWTPVPAFPAVTAHSPPPPPLLTHQAACFPVMFIIYVVCIPGSVERNILIPFHSSVPTMLLLLRRLWPAGVDDRSRGWSVWKRGQGVGGDPRSEGVCGCKRPLPPPLSEA